MQQKMSSDRLKSALFVTQAARTHRAALVAGLSTRLNRPALDAGALIDGIADGIDGAAEGLRVAAQAHRDELGDDPAVRAERDARAEALYGQMIAVREALGGIYGPACLEALTQTGRLPPRPDMLLESAEALVRALPVVLPQHTPRFGAGFDPAEIVESIQAGIEPLRAALKAVAREVREAEATLVQRNKARDLYDAIFSDGANALSGLFRLAGMPEHAKRVRPSRRAPGRVRETDESGPLPPSDAPEG